MAIGYLDSTYLDNIADAIREKNGSQNTYTPSQMPQAILDIPTGAEEKPGFITFYDWDGKILYTYTQGEIQNLQSLPALPSDYKDYHADSWTEELTTLQTTTVPMNVGINYTTERQTNRLYITLNEYTLEVRLYADFNTQIDWGDGTTTTADATTYHTHVYERAGDYVIETNQAYLGTSSSNSPIIYSPGDFPNGLPSSASSASYTTYNSSILRWVELGDSCRAGDPNLTDNGVFQYCWNMDRILVPVNAGIVSNGQWSNGGGLKFCGVKFVTIPSIGTNATYGLLLNYLPYLERFVIPTARKTCTSINGFLQNSYGMKDIVMPWSTVSISSTSISTSSMPYLERFAIKGVLTQGFSLNLSGTYTPRIFKELWFEEGLTTINGFYLNGTPSCSEVFFPSTLTSLTTNGSLPKIAHFKSVNPPTWTTQNVSICTVIYVPAESVEAYKTAWPDCASIIKAEPTS